MRILFDHNAPKRLAPHLQGHSVSTAKERGWDRLTNGDLLATAEKADFELILTADKEHALSAKSFSPKNLDHRPRPLAMAGCQFVHRRSRRRCERGNARQLSRG